ncbi:MAG: DUF4129 domain-containing protein [Streptosporangiales bacterium]
MSGEGGPRRRDRLDLRALLAALGVAALVALVAYAAGGGSPITSTRLPLVHVSQSPTPSLSLTATPVDGGRSMSDSIAMVIFGLIVLVVAVPLIYVLVRLVLVLLGIVNRNDVIRARWDDEDLQLSAGEPIPEAERAERLIAGIDAGLADLEAGRGARVAVIDCWVRLERAAADAGVTRRPEETATDLAVRMLAGERVRRQALDRLLVLYHLARYSRHPITSDDVDAARSVLAEIRHDLASQPVDTV